jgi:hypothetical protein
MNIFEEFKQLALEMERRQIKYALVGGIAMAFYAEPRFTRDLDLLVASADFEKLKNLLEGNGYFEPDKPWDLKNIEIRLHRFLKPILEDELMIDVLVAQDDEIGRIIENSVEAESEEGRIFIASKEDLIRLKRARDSKQDQADIEKLEYEEN